MVIFAILLWSFGQAETGEAQISEQVQTAVARGGSSAAVGFLKELVAKEPKNLAARFFLVAAYEATGDLAACIALSESYAERDARIAGVLWTCYDGSGEADKALQLAKQAVAWHPQAAELYRWYGVSLSKAKDGARAIPLFETAIRLSTDGDATSLYLLAQHYRAQADPIASLLVGLRFLIVEPEGRRTLKAREQLQALVKTRVLVGMSGETTAAVSVVPVDSGPNQDAELAKAERVMGIYCGPTSASPALSPERLTRCIGEVRKAIPASSRAVIREVFAVYFDSVEKAGHLRGLSDAALAVSSPAATAFWQWERK